MTTQHARRIRLAPWALLLVSASWGWAFVIMKDSIARQSVNNFLFSRFALAVIVMMALRPQVFKHFNTDLVTRSAFAGAFHHWSIRCLYSAHCSSSSQGANYSAYVELRSSCNNRFGSALITRLVYWIRRITCPRQCILFWGAHNFTW